MAAGGGWGTQRCVPTPNGAYLSPRRPPQATSAAAREFRSSAAFRADPVKSDEIDHATGLERKVLVSFRGLRSRQKAFPLPDDVLTVGLHGTQELEAAGKGVDYFGQDFKWLDSVRPPMSMP